MQSEVAENLRMFRLMDNFLSMQRRGFMHLMPVEPRHGAAHPGDEEHVNLVIPRRTRAKLTHFSFPSFGIDRDITDPRRTTTPSE